MNTTWIISKLDVWFWIEKMDYTNLKLLMERLFRYAAQHYGGNYI